LVNAFRLGVAANTTRLQQVEGYVRGYIGKPIYRFHNIVFNRGKRNLECHIRTTHRYGLWQTFPIRYRSNLLYFFRM